MFSSEVLPIVIGLVFIYLLYSLLATILQELIATLFNFRAQFLEKALCRMLSQTPAERRKSIFYKLFALFRKKDNRDALVDTFYNHPLVRSLSARTHAQPSYISRETFSRVMVDLLRGRNARPGEDMAPLVQQALDNGKTTWSDVDLPENSETLLYLRSIWTEAQADVDRFKELLEQWFDEIMDRASEWYKEYTQIVLLVLGFGIAAVFNVDTIAIVGKLEKDPALREQVLTQAERFLQAHPNLDEEIKRIQDGPKADSLKKDYQLLIQRRDTLLALSDSLIHGDIAKINNVLSIDRAEKVCPKLWCWCTLRRLTGWLLTALAISLGAPFWFDLLNKMMRLRSATQAAAGQTTAPVSTENVPLKIVRKG